MDGTQNMKLFDTRQLAHLVGNHFLYRLHEKCTLGIMYVHTGSKLTSWAHIHD